MYICMRARVHAYAPCNALRCNVWVACMRTHASANGCMRCVHACAHSPAMQCMHTLCACMFGWARIRVYAIHACMYATQVWAKWHSSGRCMDCVHACVQFASYGVWCHAAKFDVMACIRVCSGILACHRVVHNAMRFTITLAWQIRQTNK